MTTSLQHKGLTKLLGLSYEIQYKKGVENIAADALSRKFEEEVECNGISMVQPSWVQEVISSYEDDIEVAKLLSQLLLDDKTVPNMTLQQGVLRYKRSIWVGGSGHLRQQLVEAMHTTTWGGHFGVHATQQRLKSLFYWSGLSDDVKRFALECDVCQRNKSENVAYPRLL